MDLFQSLINVIRFQSICYLAFELWSITGFTVFISFILGRLTDRLCPMLKWVKCPSFFLSICHSAHTYVIFRIPHKIHSHASCRGQKKHDWVAGYLLRLVRVFATRCQLHYVFNDDDYHALSVCYKHICLIEAATISDFCFKRRV